MNNLQVFNNTEFGAVRVIEIDSEPWFVAKDISDFLNYSDASAMTRYLDEDEKTTCQIDSMSKSQIIINESGLYSAILKSKRPEAKRFKRWVTSEVLPSIRRTGGYIGNVDEMSEEEIMAKALLVANKTIERKNLEINNLKEANHTLEPKGIFADAVSSSSTTILVGELAKILKQNGVDTGQKRFFEWLRDKGYLIKRKGSDYNMPTQRSMELGLFEIKETSITHADGHISINKTSKVTGKGSVYFANKFLNKE